MKDKVSFQALKSCLETHLLRPLSAEEVQNTLENNCTIHPTLAQAFRSSDDNESILIASGVVIAVDLKKV